MTDSEKKLLRQQAEALAFIHDLRRKALLNGDVRYVKMTEGIDDRIETRQREYPTIFKRYFNEALKRADNMRVKGSVLQQPVKQNGKREGIPNRKAKTQEEKEPLREVQKKPHKKRKRRTPGGKRPTE